jgi:hypothetical protein
LPNCTLARPSVTTAFGDEVIADDAHAGMLSP